MKRFVSKTILLLLPVFISLLPLEIILRHIPNDYMFKSSYLSKNANNIEVLILGSSHSYFGVNPKYFSGNTFNAAHVSQSLDYDYEILMKYENDFNNLKTIYLPISYFTLWSRLENGKESWRCKNYVIYYGMEPRHVTDYSEVLSNKLGTSLKKAIKYVFLNSSDIRCSVFGWGTSYKSEKSRDLEKTGLTAALRHTRDNIESKKYREIFSENTLILQKILDWSQQKEINVILFTPPAFSTYRDNLNNMQLEVTIETSNQFASEYSNCLYFNIISDSSFVANDFYDADHLSEIGAEKLSVILNNIVMQN